MANNGAIHFLRGSGHSKSSILEDGQPYFDKTNNDLYVGKGSPINSSDVLFKPRWDSIDGKITSLQKRSRAMNVTKISLSTSYVADSAQQVRIGVSVLLLNDSYTSSNYSYVWDHLASKVATTSGIPSLPANGADLYVSGSVWVVNDQYHDIIVRPIIDIVKISNDQLAAVCGDPANFVLGSTQIIPRNSTTGWSLEGKASRTSIPVGVL